jgi:hypothetical protein
VYGDPASHRLTAMRPAHARGAELVQRVLH